MFQQAKQSRAFQDIITQIQEAIISKELKEGDKLPAERKLKEIFQTSRGTLREALRVLEQKGLIEIKTGVNGGAIVKKITTRKVSESLDLLLKYKKVSMDHLARFREDVEGVATGLAAERATGDDISRLKQMLDKLQALLMEGLDSWDEFIDIDSEFHMLIVEIAGNPIYESVLMTIHENIHGYYNDFLPKNEQIMKDNFQDMCDIVKAIEAGDSSLAQQLARRHIEYMNKYMKQ